jgi:cupin 2 domain-containing protein
MIRSGNLRDGLPSGIAAGETFDTLIEHNNLRIERIVSTGQATPEGEWYDQEEAEFVLLVAGEARLRIEGEAEDRELGEGDYIFLPPHCRHRVTFTRTSPPTIWLAMHFAAQN